MATGAISLSSCFANGKQPSRSMRSTLRKIQRLVGLPTTTVPAAPRQLQNTFSSSAGQWYLPSLGGTSTFWSEIVNPATLRMAIEIMRRLTPDHYLEYLLDFYQAGIDRFGNSWVYADINTVLLGVSKLMQPKSYMEIGVRRGRSMAMVVSQVPDCHVVGFDLWIQNYAGMENTGEAFVKSELGRIGHQGKADFVTGDSKITIPQFFKEQPDVFFDLITVDGDHSVEGARSDLLSVIPRLKVGGVLVFDDTANQSHAGLAKLWHAVVGRNPQFAVHTFNEVGFGVGFAVKKC